MFKGLKITSIIFLFAVITLRNFSLIAQVRIKLPDILNENSGLVYLKDGSCIWINDSGNRSALYQTNLKGSLIKSYEVPCPNIDWEDLTIDHGGNLYIGDFGDNNGERGNYKIYMVSPEKVLYDSIRYRYQNLNSFAEKLSYNAESLVWIKGKLHIFTKGSVNKGDYLCRHYTLLDDGRDQLALFQESYDFKKYVITGSALSPDGNVLALLAYRYKFILGFIPDTDSKVFFYRLNNNSGSILNNLTSTLIIPTWFGTRQYESITFKDNDHLLIASEKTGPLKPILRKVKIPGSIKHKMKK